MLLHELWLERIFWEWDRISPRVLQSLHWLPISKPNQYKTLFFTYQCVHETVPQYIQDLVCSYDPSRTLRSSSHFILIISRFGNTNKALARSFRNPAPTDPRQWAQDCGMTWRVLCCLEPAARHIPQSRRVLFFFFCMFVFCLVLLCSLRKIRATLPCSATHSYKCV